MSVTDAFEKVKKYVSEISGLTPPVRNGTVGAARYSGPIDVGYPKARKDIPEQYMVTIRSSFGQGVVIRAAIQDKLAFEVSSDWQPFLSSVIPRSINATFQFATGKALLNRFASRRIWLGTTPLSITLPLKFEATQDANVEVVSACRALQKLVLPSQSGGINATTYDKLTSIPPGPSPYSIKQLNMYLSKSESPTIQKGEHWGGRGDVISVRLGKMVYLKPVIISKVNVSFSPQLTIEGFPIGATAEVSIQTYEVLTKEALDSEVYGLPGATTNEQSKELNSGVAPPAGVLSNPGS
ncbi:MAG: hypothetical protein ACTSWQ_05930 [Candidatus Thorarchaeota archaeon]